MIFTFMNSSKFNLKLSNATRDPVSIAMLILLVVLAYLVIWPFFQLVINTLTWSEGSRRISREAVPGAVSYTHLRAHET